MVGGLLLIGIITNFLNIAEIPSEYVKVASGLIILLALSVDAIRRRGRAVT
jgi:ribose/xylose/arabinose/galactoside ABC-type transport system permease subunit